METSHKEYVKNMLAISNMGNMNQVYQGYHSIPKPYKLNAFEIKMWNLNGTITSPYYGGEFVEEYYKRDTEIHLMLELPVNIKEIVGFGSLQIELEVDTREEQGWEEQVVYLVDDNTNEVLQDKIFTLHTTKKNWTDAEAACQRVGRQKECTATKHAHMFPHTKKLSST